MEVSSGDLGAEVSASSKGCRQLEQRRATKLSNEFEFIGVNVRLKT